MLKVLMTGAGAPGGPGLILAISKIDSVQLHVCDADPNASGFLLCNRHHIVPRANDEDYIDAILNLCKNYEINVILPLVTMELFQFSKYINLFQSIGVKIVVSPERELDIANNKSKLLLHLSNNGIPVPEFVVTNDVNEIEKNALSIGYPHRNVVVKPSISNGSRGVRILSEKYDEFSLLFNEKPNNMIMPLSRYIEIIRNHRIPEILLSEYLPGDEYTVDALIDRGEIKIILPRKRIKMNGGISTSGQFENNTEIIHQTRMILRTLNLQGPIGLQFKADINGRYRILEINPRLQGTSVAAMGVGINLAKYAIYGIEDGTDVMENVKWDTKFTRIYKELYH